MVRLTQSIYDQIRRHGEAAYPNEGCGVLLGELAAGIRMVHEAIAVDNSSASPRNHYEISPQNLINILRHARTRELQILGFYHSHPDHPAQPSTTDLAEAHWIGCSYVIAAVRSGAVETTNSFLLAGSREEDKRFEAEEVIIHPDPPARPVQ